VTNKLARSPLETMDLKEFSRRLTDLMARKGLSQSDLARAIWGGVEDNRGRNTARNRDRISHYVRGSQMPEPKTLLAISRVLGVEMADLNPALDRTPNGRQDEQPILTMVGGRPDLALLSVNRVVPMKVALEVLGTLMRAEAAGDE
jgi:transcriptional regulator with XRE-family HTH domain